MSVRSALGARKRRTVLAAAGAIAAMLALTAYSPSLYRLFCDVTGYNGTTQRSSQAPANAAERKIVIRFTAETQPDLPWRFAPVEREITVKVGEQRLAHYVAENKSDERATGMAVFNVAPLKAGQYFDKIACFCFDEQTLGPHQRADMPVSFFVDPKILTDRNLDDVHTITLSYTFYRAVKQKQAERPAAARNAPN
ncbi:MAG TPA: cytochrome c oxidase assembly protein [Alphaproteobacteria bacterium]|jgi:cytochrome c oxidase assembly protein subunit 11